MKSNFKKVFFILDWDFAYVFTPIANKLIEEKKINGNVDCLNVGRNYYQELTEQLIQNRFNNINSLDEVYEQNIYNKKVFSKEEKSILIDKISLLENRYSSDETLWKYVWADRNHIKDKYFYILNMIVVFFEYFENLYTKEKIDLIVTNAYASMPHLISFAVAKKLGIKIIVPELLRIDKKSFWSISNEYKLNKNLKPSDISIQKAKEMIQKYRENFDKPFYEKINDKKRKDYFGGIKRFFRYSFRYYITKKYTGHTKPNPFKKLFNEELKVRLQRKYINRLNLLKKIDIKELNEFKYVYFPLHMQPEATTMTCAPFYLNQIFVAETLSKSLPMDYRLVIKEHPNMFGKNTILFYKQLKELPNVILLHPSIDSKELIKKSKMIFTITGTVGLEGLILKKPVITVGNVFFNNCDLVLKLKDIAITKWSELIRNKLDNYLFDEYKLEYFLSSVIEESYDMLIMEPDYYTEMTKEDLIKNQKQIIDSILKILND